MENLSSIQLDFIAKATDLNWAVINFGISNKEFKEVYGCTKSKMKKEVDKLFWLVNKEKSERPL